MTIEQMLLANNIANVLDDLARACRHLSCPLATKKQISEAQKTLKLHHDNYWNGLIVGAGQIDELLRNEQETA